MSINNIHEINEYLVCEEENPYSGYFTQIPNILFHLGLSGNDIIVYCVLKRSAGVKGCFKSIATIAKEAGVSENTVRQSKKKLSEIIPIIKKPLIKISKRPKGNGDNETDHILVIDIQRENYEFFSKNNPGSKNEPPLVQKMNHPGSNMNHPGSKTIPKEELTKKNQLNKKTTTTPTPSKSKVVVVSDEEKVFAKKLKEFIDKRSDEVGSEWILDISFFEKIIKTFGIEYVEEQFNYVWKKQKDWFKNRENPYSKHQKIDKPKSYIELACKKNYAQSEKQKENL